MMFGPSVLRAANEGQLPVVRLSAYDERVDDYQGVLAQKGAVQECVERALTVDTSAHLDPEVAAGCRRLVAMLIEAAADVTPPVTD
jgi:hypothetical protein